MNAAFKSAAGAAEVLDAYRAVLAEWPVPSEQLRVRTRFGETFVVAYGPTDAPARRALAQAFA